MQTPAEYVEAHLPLLTRYAYSRRFRPAGIDPEDFRSDLVDQVLRAHHTFRQINDPKIKGCPHCNRKGCSTWLGWRARKAASIRLQQLQRDADRLDTEVQIEDAAEVATVLGGPRAMQARAQVALLLDSASPEQRAALISKLQGWSGAEIRDRLGIGLGGRNWRIQQLLAAYTE